MTDDTLSTLQSQVSKAMSLRDSIKELESFLKMEGECYSEIELYKSFNYNREAYKIRGCLKTTVTNAILRELSNHLDELKKEYEKLEITSDINFEDKEDT